MDEGRNCTDSQTKQDLIKDEYINLTNDFYEYEQGQADIIVKDRLKNNIEFWKSIADDFIVDTLLNGYKIPFYSDPESMRCSNNKSALQNSQFVSDAVRDLEKRGLIARCNNIPHVVNPLSVAVQNNGKKRLILDLRLVNKHLWKQSFKFEDLKVAISYLTKNCWLMKYDIHSAYHHLNVYEPHTDMLGFSWEIEGEITYFKFLVLPFGLSTAPYIYSKVMRPLVCKWRGEGKKVTMYLDDGFGCDTTLESTYLMSAEIKHDLILSGFVPKAEKCFWEPTQCLKFLGSNINSSEGFLEIPVDRVDKALHTLYEIEHCFRVKARVQVKKIASFVGQIISMAIVIGNVSQIMTKCLSMDICNAKHWFDFVTLSENSISQLEFWRENLRQLNYKRIFGNYSCTKVVYSDASSVAFAGYEVSTPHGIAWGEWVIPERTNSSTWRELKAVYRVMKSLIDKLRQCKVKWYTDNAGICTIIPKGSMNRGLQQIALDIFSVCVKNSITLDVEWIPRTENEKADYYSKIIDYDDWGLSTELFNYLNEFFGPLQIDWFASEHNAKLPCFFSRFWCENTLGIDAFSENWGGYNGLFVPPITLISKVILHMKMCKAYGLLVIPLWKSAPFWPLLCTGEGVFEPFVMNSVELPVQKQYYLSCKTGTGMFGNYDLRFPMLAVQLSFAHIK